MLQFVIFLFSFPLCSIKSQSVVSSVCRANYSSLECRYPQVASRVTQISLLKVISGVDMILSSPRLAAGGHCFGRLGRYVRLDMVTGARIERARTTDAAG